MKKDLYKKLLSLQTKLFYIKEDFPEHHYDTGVNMLADCLNELCEALIPQTNSVFLTELEEDNINKAARQDMLNKNNKYEDKDGKIHECE